MAELPYLRHTVYNRLSKFVGPIASLIEKKGKQEEKREQVEPGINS